ncbi:hypothetical protein O181_059295 [Austropuccinia psidii MF-1]|uniref:Uncharacterized protein n=1 Tax=Austropuccinia psidii MF-1 TaxID=1389203 RepID=A0A9Q3HYL9_9BASI|nr:hypothetical protein [Austropuccinia psidii MF-1]
MTQKNRSESISVELINLEISNNVQKPHNLANRASFNPSRSSQKGYRHHYGRSQSVTEGQGSVNETQTDKLCHCEADNTVSPSNRAETAKRSLSGHIQSHSAGLPKCIAAQIVSDSFRSVETLHEL